MTFLLLAVANIVTCFVLLVGWLWRNASTEVYEYLLTSAYNEFVSPSNKSKKKVSLEDLQKRASGSSFFMILSIPAFWGRLIMFVCSLCILLISPLFSVLFVCDGFRFPGISYIFGAFSAKGKEFLTLGYLTASIIFINAVIGLVFFWDLFAKGENEPGSSECTSLFQCTLTFIVLGWQGGGLSDLLTPAKDTPQGTPFQIGSPKPESYLLHRCAHVFGLYCRRHHLRQLRRRATKEVGVEGHHESILFRLRQNFRRFSRRWPRGWPTNGVHRVVRRARDNGALRQGLLQAFYGSQGL
jgi:hypothetical protein